MKRLLYITVLLPLLLVSCISELLNSPPVIEEIILETEGDFTPGSDIRVTAIVADEDGDQLEYLWETQGGIIAEPNQISTSWELSTLAEPLSYESISLTVSDGKEQVTRTRTIQVIEGLVMSGYTCYTGTTIPVPDVEVSISKFSAVSDKNGYYIIQHLKEGFEQVVATKSGFERFESMVYVDNPRSNYNIAMLSHSETRRITGYVKTIDNFTFDGLKVVLLNPDGSESGLSGLTDQNGYYEIDIVPMGFRDLMVRSEGSQNIFLNDTVIYNYSIFDMEQSFDARIKIKRTIIEDSYMSGIDLWDYNGSTAEGFYVLKKGEKLEMNEFFTVPAEAEKAMLYIDSYVVGGCNLIGRLPSHRVWIMNSEYENIGGLSWGGEGNNFKAEVSWYLSDSPSFLNVYGKAIKLSLEIYEGSS
ncbi:MAG TPA: carboxypeptidase regulatory-like domain-containing protein, partial [Bacteroidaceae bacterium]|nr:carboxypeptidase regulatory-like domain-containing protein [Bacteroidaceae bacterium]